MARVLCVGDLHVMDKPPAGATDLYLDDLFASMHWAAEYAADPENGIDAVVWAGDIFHHKNPARTSHATVLRMIEVIRAHGETPVYAVVGNHDISSDRVESVYEKQPLGVLYEAGLKELNGWHPSLPIFGVPWQQEWEAPGVIKKAFKDFGDRKTPALAVTHCSIFPPGEAPEMYDSINPEAIAEAMGNEGSLYYGHIHENHGVFKVGGVNFANVGALSRGSLHEYNVERGIHVAVWDDGDFEIVDVPHMPATDILRVAEHHEDKREKKDLDSFISTVGSSSLTITSTADVIHHIKGLEDVKAPVKAYAIARLEEVV